MCVSKAFHTSIRGASPGSPQDLRAGSPRLPHPHRILRDSVTEEVWACLQQRLTSWGLGFPTNYDLAWWCPVLILKVWTLFPITVHQRNRKLHRGHLKHRHNA